MEELETAFGLPLNEAEFRLALSRGLGRALVHVRQYGVTDWEPILEGCLRNQCYDAQCEGDRARWMMAFLDQSGERILLERLIPIMVQGTAGFWDRLQHCRLAYFLASRGHDAAREALYANFGVPDAGGDLVGLEEILDLDGLEGFSEVLRLLRQRVPAQRWPEVVPTLVSHVTHRWEDLDPLPWLKRWELDGLEKVEVLVRSLDNLNVLPESPRPPRPQSNLEGIFRNVDGPEEGYGLGYQCRHIDNEVAGKLFEQLGSERSPGRLAKLLRCFTQRDLPEVNPEVIALADHPSKKVRWAALLALSRLAHPLVRKLALRCLARKRWRNGELKLFERNFQAGDAVALEEILVTDAHELISDLTAVCESVNSPELVKVMLFVYEVSNCSICRRAIVKLLRSMGIFPKWAEAEWPLGFPAFGDDPIRALHARPNGVRN